MLKDEKTRLTTTTLMMMMMTLYSAGGAGSVVMTTVTVDRPFAYSTSTWHDGGCHKNVSKFIPVHIGMSSDDAVTVKVDQRTYNDDQTTHQYLLTSVDRSPHLNFYLPGTRHTDTGLELTNHRNLLHSCWFAIYFQDNANNFSRVVNK